MEESKYLPIGTVVLLNGGQKQLVICGYCTSISEDGNKFDYTGIMYPEGVQSRDNYFFFNHSDIAKLLYKGYESKEYKELNEDLIQQFGG